MIPLFSTMLFAFFTLFVFTDAVTLGRKPHQHPDFIKSLKPLGIDVSSAFIPRINPFTIYLNIPKMGATCNNKQVCLCYWGYSPDRPQIYEKDLSAAEKEQIRETGYPEIRQARPGFSFAATPCSDINMDTWVTKIENTVTVESFEEAAKKTDQTAEDYARILGHFEPQALCFKVFREFASHDTQDKLFHVEVQATPDSSSEVYRFENEGIVPVIINTKKAVMQPLSELPTDIAAIFYFTPQIATFTSFSTKKIQNNNRGKLILEDKFVELGVKSESGCNAIEALYYDPVELYNTHVVAYPHSVKEYIGTYLAKLNVTDPKHMRKRNMTSSLIPIFEEISSNLDAEIVL